MSAITIEAGGNRPGILEQITVVGRREGNLIDAHVPMEFIQKPDDVPLDPNHVAELTAQIKAKAERDGGTGQRVAITLGHVPGVPLLQVTDGYHRYEALRVLNQGTVFATIEQFSSMAEVWDARIRNTPHRNIRFARIIDFIPQAWALTPWANRINALQAFQTGAFSNISGTKMGLTERETQDARVWIAAKSEEWGLKPGSIYQQLLTGQFISPALIRRSRERGGKDKLARLSPQHLTVIGRALKHEFGLQHIVADAVDDLGLSARQTGLLAVSLQGVKSIDEAREIIRSGSWRFAGSRWGQLVEKKTVEVDGFDIGNFSQHIDALVRDGFTSSPDGARKIVEKVLAFIQKQTKVKRYKNTEVYALGDLIEKIWFLKSGSFIICKDEKDGRRYISEIATPGAIVGTEYLVNAREYVDGVETLSDSVLIPISLERIRHERDPFISLFLLVDHGIAVRRQHERLKDLEMKDVSMRLAYVLLEILKRPEVYKFKTITQSILGQLTGATRESVNKYLGVFQDIGAITWDGREGPQYANKDLLQKILNGEIDVAKHT